MKIVILSLASGVYNFKAKSIGVNDPKSQEKKRSTRPPNNPDQ